jgi:hypothetical protein
MTKATSSICGCATWGLLPGIKMARIAPTFGGPVKLLLTMIARKRRSEVVNTDKLSLRVSGVMAHRHNLLAMQGFLYGKLYRWVWLLPG